MEHLRPFLFAENPVCNRTGLIRNDLKSCPRDSGGVVTMATDLWMGSVPVECACVMRGCQLWHHHHPHHHVDQRLTRVACNLLIQLTGFTAPPLLRPRLFSTFSVSFHSSAFISLFHLLRHSIRKWGGGAPLAIFYPVLICHKKRPSSTGLFGCRLDGVRTSLSACICRCI